MNKPLRLSAVASENFRCSTAERVSAQMAEEVRKRLLSLLRTGFFTPGDKIHAECTVEVYDAVKDFDKIRDLRGRGELVFDLGKNQ